MGIVMALTVYGLCTERVFVASLLWARMSEVPKITLDVRQFRMLLSFHKVICSGLHNEWTLAIQC